MVLPNLESTGQPVGIFEIRSMGVILKVTPALALASPVESRSL
jgi:hypothetical protein